MARRQSDSDKKAEAAKALAETETAAEGEPEDLEEATAPTEPEPEPQPDLQPAAAKSEPGKKESFLVSGKLPDGPLARPIPNKPSFDWSKKGDALVPNLDTAHAEEIVEEDEREGIKVVRTNRGRWIFLCTAKEYEVAFGSLPSRQLFLEAFPNAFD